MQRAQRTYQQIDEPRNSAIPSQRAATMGQQADHLVLNPAVKARRNGLWLPVRLTLEAWSEIGAQIADIGNASAWWLGDWLIYGKNKFPNRYKKAINETSLDYQTLRNYAWVCRQFSVPRRRATLSFQHHAELASLPTKSQDEWLDKAEALRWSLHELRQQLRAGGVGNRRSGRDQVTLKLAITASQKERWRQAASAAGIEMDEWVVITLDSAAGGTGDF